MGAFGPVELALGAQLEAQVVVGGQFRRSPGTVRRADSRPAERVVVQARAGDAEIALEARTDA